MSITKIISRTKRRLGELLASHGVLTHESCAGLFNSYIASLTRLKKQEDEVERLRKKLLEYGRHNTNCNSLHPAGVDGNPGDMTCDCGLEGEAV